MKTKKNSKALNPTKGLQLSDFSFEETKNLLKKCNSSFAEEVITERRKEL